MAPSGVGEPAPTERVLRTRTRAAAPARVEDEEPTAVEAPSRKRARRAVGGRAKPATESDDPDATGHEPEEGVPATATGDQGDDAETNAARPLPRESKRKAAAVSGPSAANDGEKDDDEETELLASVSRDTRKMTTKRKRGTILAEFSSLDALLNNDLEEKKRKAQRADKLQRLREEAKGIGKRGGRMSLDASPMAKMMSDISNNISSLSADNHLFADDLLPPRTHEEKYGFVFTPITQPLMYQPFKATPSELKSDLKLVYKAMQTTKDDELGALLWSNAILLRALVGSEQVRSKKKPPPGSLSPVHPVVVPERICSWLFLTMSTHSNSHVVKGCLRNLFTLVSGSSHDFGTDLKSGLPCASFCLSVQDLRTAVGDALPDLQMEWRPTIYDFLGALRRFGFQDSKRSMSARSKIVTTKKTSSQQQRNSSSNKPAVPFPTMNMQYVLAFLILSLRTKLLRPDGYDVMSFTMFFLRMQFEHNMHPEIVQLATICIEELLEVFSTVEWRKEWGQSLVMRIAGANEGMFDSASGWLTVARRLPRTKRGTQLTTGLAIYVLQHRIDKSPDDVSKSERPLKFPIQSGLVLDIVAGIVEDMTAKYTEKKKLESNSDKAGNARLPPPPFDLLCKKVALMDLALQAFLNELTHREMSVLLGKLDDLTSSHKSTMSAKWHELKTLVGLMRRKYSLENLRVGRADAPSPRAKAVLFLDDEDQDPKHDADSKDT